MTPEKIAENWAALAYPLGVLAATLAALYSIVAICLQAAADAYRAKRCGSGDQEAETLHDALEIELAGPSLKP